MLRQKLTFFRGCEDSGRAARFRHRVGTSAAGQGHDPDLATIVKIPDWAVAPTAVQNKLAEAIAVLNHRSAIDQELSGTKLAALAEAVGAELFDQLYECAMPDRMPPAGASELPRPEDLVSIGQNYMERALPCELSGRFTNAANDPQAQALCAAAYALIAPTQGEAP